MVSNVFSAKPPKTHVKVLSICQLSTAPGYGMITMSKGSSSPGGADAGQGAHRQYGSPHRGPGKRGNL